MEHTLQTQNRKELYLRLAVRLVVTCLVIWCVAAHFGGIVSLLLPFLLAYFLAKLLNVIVNWLTGRLRISRKALSFLCVSAMVAALGIIAYFLSGRIVEELTQLASSWDDIRAGLMETVTLISQKLSSLSGRDEAQFQSDVISAMQSGLNWLNERISEWTPSVAEQTGNVASGAFSLFLSCVMFFVACFYFTTWFPELDKKLWDRFPAGVRARARKLRQAVSVAAGGYLKAQLILSGLVMVFLLIAFLIYGQKYAVLLSVLIGIVDFIPIFGSGTILVPWAIIALLGGNISQSVFLLAMAAFLFVFRKVAEPKIVGNQTGLSTLLSLMCIYVGMKLNGMFGMIIAPIICLVLRSLNDAGTFDSVYADLRLAWRDVRSLMTRPDTGAQEEQPAGEPRS